MFKLTVVTPEKRIVLNQEVEEVTLPAFAGELNILTGHSPLITTLETGVLKWRLPGEELNKVVAISWGYCHVSPDGVSVLADMALLPEEINLGTTQEKVTNLEAKLGSEFLTDEEWSSVQRELALAKATIEAAPLDQKVH